MSVAMTSPAASANGQLPNRHAAPTIVLSFDIEEHHRIEAAVGVQVGLQLRAIYAERMAVTTRWLLDELVDANHNATFFIVGEIGRSHPRLVRAISDAGHEIASHSWDHRRLHTLTPSAFREDLRLSKDALEQAAGAPVLGYRAPTFSLDRQTAWAIDVLAEEGFQYDSSIYPVRHDRYGVPDAPRGPFRVGGANSEMLELPPTSLRLGPARLPMGGGGYFRLFPTRFMEWSITQTARECTPAVSMIYFHPWEFDPHQPRLPLPLLSRVRTYAGVYRSQPRLRELLHTHRFVRAIDAAQALDGKALPSFRL
jgi:polysaccharide deacetylase family protein (PEP-CTERM system associated)